MLFQEIVDNIIMQLKIRFNDTHKLLFLQLGDVTKCREYSSNIPYSGLNSLKTTYKTSKQN